MQWPKFTTHSPIGVDVGRRSVKAVQLARTRTGWRIAAAAVLPRLETEPLLSAKDAERLRDVLYRQGFRGSQVVLAAPGNALHAEALELPPRDSDAPLEQIARSELARLGKLDADSFEMALWDLPSPARSKGTTHAMGVALRHTDADAVLGVMESQGLQVTALDCSAWAMARACESQAAAAITGVLDIGWSSALLVLLYKGTVVYQRLVSETGLAALRTQVVSELEVDEEAAEYLMQRIGVLDKDPEGSADLVHVRAINTIVGRMIDAIAGELDVPFSYAAHRYPDAPVEKLLMVGGGSALPGVGERIGGQLNIPVKTVSPFELAECPAELRGRCGNSLLTTALGLARHPGE